MQPYSKLRDPSRTSLAPQLPLAHPWAMFVELSNRCNFKCKFCPESLDNYAELVGGISSLSFDQFKKMVADVLDLGRLKVMRFYMLGEPFLHRELPDFLAYAKEQNVADRIEITSNGTAITKKTAQRIIESQLDYLRISVYAIDPERHLRITGSTISPDRVRENVRTVFETRREMGSDKPYLYVKMINPFDKEEEAKFFENYRDICDEVVIEQPMNWENSVDFLNEVYGDSNVRTESSIFAYKKEVCTFPFYSLVMHSSGDVSVCCVDWEKKTVVGNLFQESLRDIWHGKRLREFQRMQIERRRHENEACKNCNFLYTSPDDIDEITDIKMLYPDA